MGYIREPKNVDLLVGPSVLTEATRQTITQAIARYKKTGQKPVSAQLVTQETIKATTPPINRAKTHTNQQARSTNRKAKI